MFPVIQKSKLFGVFCIWEDKWPCSRAGWAFSRPLGLLEVHQGQTSMTRSFLPVCFFTDYSKISPGGPHKPPGCFFGDPQTLCFTLVSPALFPLERVKHFLDDEEIHALNWPNKFPFFPVLSRPEENSERSEQPEISFFSPLWFWDSLKIFGV